MVGVFIRVLGGNKDIMCEVEERKETEEPNLEVPIRLELGLEHPQVTTTELSEFMFILR